VNKVGSLLLGLACRDAGTPLYVVADPSKRVPASWPRPEYARGRPFEAVPRALVTEVFDGVESLP
jgi:translation initiation factor 2B subunit (eIF-2B alpha/beta/delta family)